MNRAPRSRTVTELKIPARPAFVIVAKRAASALASTAGFSLEGIDDLNIAVAQACDKAIAAGDRMWGEGNGVLKLTFNLVDGGLEVEVRNLQGRRGAVRAPGSASLAQRLARVNRQVAAAAQAAEVSEMDLEDVTVNMIRLFVDELRYNVDSRGSMRMRMVKYHVD